MGKIVKPESLHVQAYNILKQSILNGDRKPADRIVEAKVADTLGISRGPVREAMRMLIQDGLLVYNDGFVKVYEPTTKDIIEIFECREALEVLAIKRTIDNLTEDTIKKLERNINETKTVLNEDAKLKQLDQQFHTIIIQASSNNHLIQLLEMIKTKIHYMRNSMETTFYPTLLDEHERILDCIKKVDVKNAEVLIENHIQKGLKDVLKRLGN